MSETVDIRVSLRTDAFVEVGIIRRWACKTLAHGTHHATGQLLVRKTELGELIRKLSAAQDAIAFSTPPPPTGAPA